MPTALIVEDEPEANKLLGMLIKLRGYHSAAAFDGREALEHLGRFSPDVLFLDLMLPDMSGYDVCRAVKAARATCLIPVVVVSARIAPSNRIDSFRAGADEFVAKPYTPDEIFDALGRARSLREQSNQDRIAGTIRFADPEDSASARDVARLRGMVLGRSPLPENEAAALGEVIRRVEGAIEEWLPARPAGASVTLDYELTAERFALAIRGVGWLDGFERASGDGLAAAFDEVAIDRDADALALAKFWDVNGTGAGR